jgi:hypothetical protein
MDSSNKFFHRPHVFRRVFLLEEIHTSNFRRFSCHVITDNRGFYAVISFALVYDLLSFLLWNSSTTCWMIWSSSRISLTIFPHEKLDMKMICRKIGFTYGASSIKTPHSSLGGNSENRRHWRIAQAVFSIWLTYLSWRCHKCTKSIFDRFGHLPYKKMGTVNPRIPRIFRVHFFL